MARAPQRFLEINAALLPYGDTGASLDDVLASLSPADTLSGMWLTYTSTRTVTVQPGHIIISGVFAAVETPFVVDIHNDLGDAGTPVTNTIYYLYATIEGDVLNLYFSSSSPTAPGVVDTTLKPDHRAVPLYHPAHTTWRYIGQVLYRSAGSILPFTVCTPLYWEGAWTAATRNVDMTLEHGWGAVPQDVRFMYSTTATNSNNVLTTVSYADPSNKFYGVRPRAISNKTIGLDIQKDALFWDNNTAAWVNSGYIKVAVRR